MRRAILLASVLAGGAVAQRAVAQTVCAAPAEACALFERYLGAFNRRDWEAFRATLDDSVSVLFDVPAPAQRFDGRAAVEAMFRRVFPPTDRPAPPLPPAIQPLNLRAQDFGDVVVISFQIGAGDEVARRTVVLHRGPTGWRVVHIHGSSRSSS